MTSQPHIASIGAGHMTRSFVSGRLRKGFNAVRIRVGCFSVTQAAHKYVWRLSRESDKAES